MFGLLCVKSVKTVEYRGHVDCRRSRGQGLQSDQDFIEGSGLMSPREQTQGSHWGVRGSVTVARGDEKSTELSDGRIAAQTIYQTSLLTCRPVMSAGVCVFTPRDKEASFL